MRVHRALDACYGHFSKRTPSPLSHSQSYRPAKIWPFPLLSQCLCGSGGQCPPGEDPLSPGCLRTPALEASPAPSSPCGYWLCLRGCLWPAQSGYSGPSSPGPARPARRCHPSRGGGSQALHPHGSDLQDAGLGFSDGAVQRPCPTHPRGVFAGATPWPGTQSNP